MDNRLDEMIGDAERFAQSLEKTAKKYDELRQSMAGLSASASTSDGRISVTVDSAGVPTAINLAPSTQGMDPAAVSAGIMSCMQRAQAKLRGRVTDLVHDLVGDEAPAVDMVGRYAVRFPDPEPVDTATTSQTPPVASAPSFATPPPYSAPPAPDPAQPRTRKPNRDQVVTPDEPDEDDEYYRKSWLV